MGWWGYCPICERAAYFRIHGAWLRDDLRCDACNSVPRERALMKVIADLYPDWRNLAIHESSPGIGGASVKLKEECSGYLPSHYMPEIGFGQEKFGCRSEDLEAQTFADESFDLVITQDVFEHLMHPDRAIREIMRTVKVGGASIMSVPITRRSLPSRRRAELVAGEVVHHLPPEYHGNPVDPDGALVTVDYGWDIADYLTHHSGHATTTFMIDSLEHGIKAEFIEIIVTRKAEVPAV